MTEYTAKQGLKFYRVSGDIYGNPRYVVHFFALLSEDEIKDGSLMDMLSTATKRANKIGGSKYRGKDFGGGIVFQSYSIDDTERHIIDVVEKYSNQNKEVK